MTILKKCVKSMTDIIKLKDVKSTIIGNKNLTDGQTEWPSLLW